tara:strand:+ start:4194 stop:4664 length:471 start_codon:yes stop_codon:yes gene_type:complete
MNATQKILAIVVTSAAFAGPALAQDVAFELPEQCIDSPAMEGMDHSAMAQTDQGDGMAGMMGMGDTDTTDMPEHVQKNMEKMMATMPAMHEGMMREDADVAFACGMIAHHQGAIDMAQVLLEYGDDPEMIELAGEIIAAQVGEIEQMTTWITENAE